MTITEQWKDITNYVGIYQGSNLGRIKSLDRYDSRNHFIRGRVLKPKLDMDGYHSVSLCKNGKCVTKKIHRLILTEFKPNPFNKEHVNHKNGKVSDNRVKNLEWVTHQENMDHAKNTGLLGKAVRCIETQIEYTSCANAARSLKIRNITGLSDAANPNTKQKTSGGYHWEYI